MCRELSRLPARDTVGHQHLSQKRNLLVPAGSHIAVAICSQRVPSPCGARHAQGAPEFGSAMSAMFRQAKSVCTTHRLLCHVNSIAPCCPGHAAEGTRPRVCYCMQVCTSLPCCSNCTFLDNPANWSGAEVDNFLDARLHFQQDRCHSLVHMHTAATGDRHLQSLWHVCVFDAVVSLQPRLHQLWDDSQEGTGFASQTFTNSVMP